MAGSRAGLHAGWEAAGPSNSSARDPRARNNNCPGTCRHQSAGSCDRLEFYSWSVQHQRNASLDNTPVSAK